MDEHLFERLLWQDESERLDFKEAPYRFEHATEEEKAELAKDIVGIANAWRDEDGYILIGVKDVRGDRSIVVGIEPDQQIADHSLQQFMRSLTDHPLRFLYRAFTFEGKQVGIIRLDVQARPVRMARNYGHLRRGEVYVRRGSHTDPQRPATAAEIQQMMIDTSRPRQADVVVEFADLERETALGTHLTWETESCRMPEEIPNYGERERSISDRMTWIQTINDANRDYYREYAKYERSRRLFQPTRFLIRNVGRVPAHRVRIEFVVSAVDGKAAIRKVMSRHPRSRGYELPQLQPISRLGPGAVAIETDADGYRLVVDCGDLQPGRQMATSRFYTGRATSGDIAFDGRIFADNLQRPAEFGVRLTFRVSQAAMTLNTLLALADQSASKR